MSKMGEKFTEQQAREYEDRGANRSEELADLLTIAEMTNIVFLVSSYPVVSPEFLDLRTLFTEARSIAERNEYAGDYDYPEVAS